METVGIEVKVDTQERTVWNPCSKGPEEVGRGELQSKRAQEGARRAGMCRYQCVYTWGKEYRNPCRLVVS